MISKENYKVEYGIPHVTDAMVEAVHCPKAVKRFRDFMRGQTMMIRSDGVPGIYAWDYERWLRSGMDNKQGLDWD